MLRVPSLMIVMDAAGVLHRVNEFCAEGMEGARPYCDVSLDAEVYYDLDAVVTCFACLSDSECMKMRMAKIYHEATNNPKEQSTADSKREAVRRFWSEDP